MKPIKKSPVKFTTEDILVTVRLWPIPAADAGHESVSIVRYTRYRSSRITVRGVYRAEMPNFRVSIRLSGLEKENARSSSGHLRRWGGNIPRNHVQAGKPRTLFSFAERQLAT